MLAKEITTQKDRQRAGKGWGKRIVLQRKKAAYPYVLKCPRHKVRIGKGQAELALSEDDKKNNKRRFSCTDQSKKWRGEMQLVYREDGV